MARRSATLDFADLKKLGVVLKRAEYFITCRGKMAEGVKFSEQFIYQNLTADGRKNPDFKRASGQLSFADMGLLSSGEERVKCLRGEL